MKWFMNLPESSTVTAPKKRRDFAGMRFVLVIVSSLFVVFALYLLSFGPVTRWCVTHSAVSSPGGGTIEVIDNYPAWVGVVYSPALHLLMVGGEDGFGAVYGRYLQWWEKSPESSP
jgi:hypothetical protein